MDIIDNLSKSLLSSKQESEPGDWQATAQELGKLSFNDFNKKIGLPQINGKEIGLMPFQLDFHNLVAQGRHKKFHVNKSRQIGMTEICIRELLYGVFTRYRAGTIVAVIAGTRVDTTRYIMSKFMPMIQRIPETVKEQTDLKIVFQNGTTIIGFPSNSSALRSYSNVSAVFMDEAAHFDLIDDSVVLDAIMPIVETSKSELFVISTPNGLRGFFYNLDIGQNDYHKLRYPIQVTKGYLRSQEEIDAILKKQDVDVDQEYLCQYTTGRSSIFGNQFTSDTFEAEEY